MKYNGIMAGKIQISPIYIGIIGIAIIVIITTILGKYLLTPIKQPSIDASFNLKSLTPSWQLDFSKLPEYKQNDSLKILESYVNTLKYQSVFFEIFLNENNSIELKELFTVDTSSSQVFFQSDIDPRSIFGNCLDKPLKGWRAAGSTRSFSVKDYENIKRKKLIFYITYRDKLDNKTYYSKNTSEGFCNALNE